MSKAFANTFAYASLACSLLYWAEVVLGNLVNAPKWELPPWGWLGTSASAVVLGIVGAVRGSKLSVLTIPLALVTFLFALLVNGS